MNVPKNANPHLFIVIGGTGDLMRRKLLPALLQLRRQDAFGDEFVLLSVGRRKWSDDRYRQWVREAMKETAVDSTDLQHWCDEYVYYQSIDEGEGYAPLPPRIEAIEKDHGLPGNRVFYLAIPPGVFPTAVQQLGETKLAKSRGWTRLVVEKPFGRDLQSAQELNRIAQQHFDESQIYRIDHYLGKETVQNLAIFRFANMLFESVWSRQYVANVQITVAEDLGVEQRAGYYENSGALRDMIQNHATQLLTLIAMDAPPRFDADAVRDEKLRVLRAVEPIGVDDVVFGQYDKGEIQDQQVAAYRNEDGVESDSTTETYVALKLSLDNWRWHGVPFYLRTGKRLPRKTSEIAIVFREPPVCLFQPLGQCAVIPDVLRLRIQPDEAFNLAFDIKVPGTPLQLVQRSLEFRYADVFEKLPDAYQTLLLDIVNGDQTHFVRADEVEASWRLYTPLLDNRAERSLYTAGTWGPAEADRLIEPCGAQWQTGTHDE
ncbi:MAG: glucose-6-phosphate dehydrogenase [Pirellulaceae bacterium]